MGSAKTCFPYRVIFHFHYGRETILRTFTGRIRGEKWNNFVVEPPDENCFRQSGFFPHKRSLKPPLSYKSPQLQAPAPTQEHQH